MTKIEAQRNQFEKALSRFKEAVSAPKTELVRDSAIQRFEFTIDLAWKTLKTYIEEKTGAICHSPKECFREAYRQKILDYDEAWLEFIDMRNETSHTYNEDIAERIYSRLPQIAPYFDKLLEILKKG